MRISLLLVALAASLASTPAAAQARDSLPLGTRIRVWLTPQPDSVEGAAQPQMLRGTLRAYSADSLSLAIHPGVAPLTLAWPAVRRVDQSRGVPSRLESGLRAGLLTAAEGMLEMVVLESISDDRTFGSTGDALLWGGALGGGFGFILGAWHPQEVWKQIHLLHR